MHVFSLKGNSALSNFMEIYMNKTKQRHITTKEAAEYLGFKVKTLANWRAEGTGPNFFRLHNRCFYTLEELDDYRDKKAQRISTIYFAQLGFL